MNMQNLAFGFLAATRRWLKEETVRRQIFAVGWGCLDLIAVKFLLADTLIVRMMQDPPAVLVHQSAHAEGDTKLSRSSSRCTSLDERLRGCSELVAGEYDLKRASLCEVLGRQEMREAEGVLRVGLRHPLV